MGDLALHLANEMYRLVCDGKDELSERLLARLYHLLWLGFHSVEVAKRLLFPDGVWHFAHLTLLMYTLVFRLDPTLSNDAYAVCLGKPSFHVAKRRIAKTTITPVAA